MCSTLGGVLAMACASSRVRCSSSAAGTARFAHPHAAAVVPLIRWPGTKDICLARFGPTRNAHSGEMKPPPSGSTGEAVITASSATMVMSQNVQSCDAPAMQ